MKKVLIISYFFPPCSLTAAQRTHAWAKYLNESGYYPIIVTRNWDSELKTIEDMLVSNGDEIKYEKHDSYEVFYLPYKSSLKDRLYRKWQGKQIQKLTRILTFTSLILENFTNKFIPHRNLFKFSDAFLQKNQDIKTVIVTANPFNLFRFGYLLKKKHPINWIADYRDDWNTSEILQFGNGAGRIIKSLQKRSEKKWVKSSALFTSVSPHYVQKIKSFLDHDGATLLNGYDDVEIENARPEKGSFTITYNGSLYPTQPIEDFISTIEQFIKENDTSLDIKLNFPGLAFDKTQEERVKKAGQNIIHHFHITPRINKQEVLRIQSRSDLLLMVAHTNKKGIPSSKLYEYIGLKKPILLFPNDNDIIEHTLQNTGLGIIANNQAELLNLLKKAIKEKENFNTVNVDMKLKAIESFSRKNQAKKLAELINRINH